MYKYGQRLLNIINSLVDRYHCTRRIDYKIPIKVIFCRGIGDAVGTA